MPRNSGPNFARAHAHTHAGRGAHACSTEPRSGGIWNRRPIAYYDVSRWRERFVTRPPCVTTFGRAWRGFHVTRLFFLPRSLFIYYRKRFAFCSSIVANDVKVPRHNTSRDCARGVKLAFGNNVDFLRTRAPIKVALSPKMGAFRSAVGKPCFGAGDLVTQLVTRTTLLKIDVSTPRGRLCNRRSLMQSQDAHALNLESKLFFFTSSNPMSKLAILKARFESELLKWLKRSNYSIDIRYNMKNSNRWLTFVHYRYFMKFSLESFVYRLIDIIHENI